jgi:hypothetical protein
MKMNDQAPREDYPITCAIIMLAVDLLALWLLCSYHDAHRPTLPPRTHVQPRDTAPRGCEAIFKDLDDRRRTALRDRHFLGIFRT